MARFIRRCLDFKSMERGSLLSSAEAIELLSEMMLKTRRRVNSVLSKFIYIITGFIDGAFKAANTSYCRSSLVKMQNSATKLYTLGVEKKSVNNTVYYSTRIVKYIHPVLFHCYYAGKETYLSFLSYLALNSITTVIFNIIYKTKPLFNDLRTLNYLIVTHSYEDRDLYVIMRSIGDIL